MLLLQIFYYYYIFFLYFVILFFCRCWNFVVNCLVCLVFDNQKISIELFCTDYVLKTYIFGYSVYICRCIFGLFCGYFVENLCITNTLYVVYYFFVVICRNIYFDCYFDCLLFEALFLLHGFDIQIFHFLIEQQHEQHWRWL